MHVSQKCQYALRALFELAKRAGAGPIKIGDVAEAQAIPPRFLEVILSQLKQGGFVESRRGSGGGYMLARTPGSITVGEIMRFVEGPMGPVSCVEEGGDAGCPLHGACVFLELWRKAREAVAGVYDGTSLQGLLDRERQMQAEYVPAYAI
jgi:Rrf2 family protein